MLTLDYIRWYTDVYEMHELDTSFLTDPIFWAANVYPPELEETTACLLNKLRVYRSGCLLCGAPVRGYIFGHPWRLGLPPVPLNCLDLKLPDVMDCWYIHDLAVSPLQRNAGVGTALLGTSLYTAMARGLRLVKLVAVLGSETWWSKFGFKVVEEITYGGSPAKVMILSLENSGTRSGEKEIP